MSASRNGAIRAAHASRSASPYIGPSEAEVEERPGDPDERWLVHLVEIGRAQDRAVRLEQRERLVDMPRPVLELHRQREPRSATGPGGGPAGRGARRSGRPRRGPGRARCRAESRSASSGRVSQATLSAWSSPSSARIAPPRWALTANRNDSGVRASQAAIGLLGRLAVERVVELARAESLGVRAQEVLAARGRAGRTSAPSPA